jgi:hypothetical protein
MNLNKSAFYFYSHCDDLIDQNLVMKNIILHFFNYFNDNNNDINNNNNENNSNLKEIMLFYLFKKQFSDSINLQFIRFLIEILYTNTLQKIYKIKNPISKKNNNSNITNNSNNNNNGDVEYKHHASVYNSLRFFSFFLIVFGIIIFLLIIY